MEVVLQTRAFEVRDGGPFAMRAWDFELQREDLVRVNGGRVLVFENLQRIRDFFGHLKGKGLMGNRAWGQAAVLNMEPVRYQPKPGDIWSREWYAQIDESPRARARLVTARG